MRSGHGGQFLLPTPQPGGTEEDKKRLVDYWAALGCFVSQFAVAEMAFQHTLWYYAGTPQNVALCVFSGTKTEAVCAALVKLHGMELIPDPAWDRLSYLIERMRAISDARDMALGFRASSVAEGRRRSTNAMMAVVEDKERAFDISAEALDEMTGELRRIATSILLYHSGRPPLRAKLAKIVGGAWQEPSPDAKPEETAKPDQARPLIRRPRRRPV